MRRIKQGDDLNEAQELIYDNTIKGKTFERTTALRWVRDPIGGLPPKQILQQGWFCMETGEVDWRAIEVVYG